jgi:hypothetical protein
MYIIHIHKIIIPNAQPESYATIKVQLGEQKFDSQMTLPLSCHHTEYNLYNERFTFQDPLKVFPSLSKSERQAQELYLKASL